MISLETDIQILYNCYEFFRKIISKDVSLFELIKNSKNIEEESTYSTNSEPNLIQIVSKISRATPKE